MTKTMRLRLGTRASPLAQWQANWVTAQLRQRGLEIELIQITTSGDQQQTVSGPIAGTGIFTKEIQRELLDGRIDLAVHSLKDLPTETRAGAGPGGGAGTGPRGRRAGLGPF